MMPLPKHYLITPSPTDDSQFLDQLRQCLQAGTRLVQLRAKGIDPERYTTLAQQAIELVHQHQGIVLLTSTAEQVLALGADGLHLDSKALKGVTSRPLPAHFLLSASGHSLAELQHAEAMGANLAVVSPVKATASHPELAPLGWAGYAEIVRALALPVYAYGGVDAGDEAEALAAGGAGIAGQRGYWPDA